MCVDVSFIIFPFLKEMVAVDSRKNTPGGRGGEPPLRFTQDVYNRFVDVFKRLRFSSRSKSFYKALDLLESELSLYVGLTPAEAVEKLRRRLPKTK